MAEYRRFISYFYAYKAGRKQKNTGFARMEQKGGRWKLLVHINSEGPVGIPMKVYGFVRDEDKTVEGVLLGKGYSSPRGMEGVFSGGTEQIGETGRRVGELAGIWVSGEDGRDFLTVWDDEPTSPEQIRRDTEGAAGMQAGRQEEENMPAVSAENTGSAPEIQEKKNTRELYGQTENRADKEAAEAEHTVQEEAAAGQTAQKAEEAAAVQTVQKAEEAATGQTAQKTEAAGTGQNAGALNRQSEQAGNSQLHMQETGTSALMLKMEEDWSRMAGHCQRMIAPEELDAVDCRIIQLSHLDYLRQRGWRTGRNSFLLHGWYQYHGLMIARMQDGGFVLGVPGSSDSQERYMARMYGFTQFYSAGNREKGPEGYWCRRL